MKKAPKVSVERAIAEGSWNELLTDEEKLYLIHPEWFRSRPQ